MLFKLNNKNQGGDKVSKYLLINFLFFSGVAR